MRRLGLFGGTFDPPHVAHLVVAERAREQLRLERVVFMPTGTPPHKRHRAVAPARHRLQMTRLAVRGNPAFTVSALETRRRGNSYTVDTLRVLSAEHPDARLYLIIGQDSLDEFATWHEPDAIRSMATLVVAPRPGGAAPRRRGRGVIHLEAPALAVSSSGIRAALRRGCSVRYLIPERVAAYVARHRLYRQPR
jgi:nicotinate-nucleotide adenylyltransferase